ncbi:MAG TPA: ABC transporter ATP-binding protein [Anaerolineae bacterium]|nr:ABC transporter ATP-binding protein [Anaerolineae bacterium]
MSETVQPVIRVEHLVKHFPLRNSKDVVHAVNDVSFEVYPRETLALVGETGSGKTTIGRCVLKLLQATSGQIIFKGQDVTSFNDKQFRPFRSRIQLVFQEPYDSLNPRWTINRILDENLKLEGRLNSQQRKARVLELLDLTRLGHNILDKYPHELTGGEQQRVGIARAISTKPDLVVLDEPTSALDISVRAEIINLLRDLQHETGIAYIFISHDLTAVKEISHRVAILYLGEIVELAPNPAIFDYQLHPYGQALLASVLFPDPDQKFGAAVLEDEIPSPVHLPSGCHLHPRCPFALPICATTWPPPKEYPNHRIAACHRAHEFLPTTLALAQPIPTRGMTEQQLATLEGSVLKSGT